MKITKILITVAVILFAASCTELDLYPDSNNVTENQKIPSPDNDVDGLNAVLIYCGSDYSGNHFDFGYPAVCMFYDAAGPDVPCPAVGTNWFRGAAEYTGRVNSSDETKFIWETLYKYINATNTVLNSTEGFEEMSSNTDRIEELRMYRGYGYAARAFGYINLVQAFQKNYTIAANAKAVPIITEDMEDDDFNDNPAATVEEIYDFILSDLEEAISLLSATTAVRPNKSYIDLSVAYGLRARTYLAMHKYAEAAADAERAINASSARYLTLAEVSQPGFNDQSVPSYMWAALIDEASRCVTTGIVNWPSHMSGFVGYSYTNAAGAWRFINNFLYDLIDSDDIRKKWWADATGYSEFADDVFGQLTAMNPYENVKYHNYQNDINQDRYACDWVLMRLEEMLFIRVEGLAMSGNTSGALTLLNNWVQTYRQPSYNFTSSNPDDIQTEVWRQRRVELWGEGHSLFDHLRLQRHIVRIPGQAQSDNSDFMQLNQRFNVDINNEIVLYKIPQDEVTGNAAITEEDVTKGDVPTQGSGLTLRDGLIW